MNSLTKTFLGSRLANRIFLLFLAGAFVPAAIVFALAMHDSMRAQSLHSKQDLVDWAATDPHFRTAVTPKLQPL